MIKVFLNESPWKDGMDFYIVDQNEFDHKQYLLHFGKHNITREEMTPYATNDETKPTFSLNAVAANEFLKSIAEKAAERGIKLESDLKREGKLEATERHLDDMRRLVFSEVK